MTAPRFNTKLKLATLIPVAALSLTWTAALVGLGVGTTANGADKQPTLLPDGSAVPAEAIDAPASVSRPIGIRGADTGQVIATASTNAIPSTALAAYQRAETVINDADPACHLPWELVAAIGRVESDHGRFGGNVLNADGVSTPGIFGPRLNGTHHTHAIADTDGGELDGDKGFDRAVGPMQFIPSTWSVVGVDADGDGSRDPQDIDDAALSTAVYLCSGKDDLATDAGRRAAVYRYNHSDAYVDLVLSLMKAYQTGDYTAGPDSVIAGPPMPIGPTAKPSHRTKVVKKKPTTPGKPTTKPTPTVTVKPTVPVTPHPTPTATVAPPTATVAPPPTTTVKPTAKPTVLPTSLPTTQISIPVTTMLPTSILPSPVTTVLTQVQAIAKCLAEGKIDNPLDPNDPFDQCVKAYTGG